MMPPWKQYCNEESKNPSIIAIRNKCKDNGSFNFIEVDQNQIENEVLKLDVNTASLSSNIPMEVVRENTDIFSAPTFQWKL